MTITDEPPRIVWGRCRDAGRWFWSAHVLGGPGEHDWAKDRHAAARKANAAAVRLAGRRYASIRVDDQAAEIKLAAVKAAKEAKAEDQQAAAGDDANLWAIEAGFYDFAARRWVHSRVVRLPIVKRTTKRIYYLRSAEPGEYEQGYIDRQAFEAQGWVWSHRYDKIFATPPKVPADEPLIPPSFAGTYRGATVPTDVELKRLKAAMRAAHPDLGGSDAEFIAARKRYVEARRRAT